MNNELLYQLALTMLPQVGDVHAKTLLNIYGNASAIFKAPKRQLERIEGIGIVRANNIRQFNAFADCEDEMAFIERYKITALSLLDKNYPKRLLHCYDSPSLLFYRGSADLNTRRIVSIVGTRNNTEHGRSVCEKLIEELSNKDVMIVSGLAFGIDTIAHRASLKNDLKTIGVLAHGLDRIYPSQNKLLARQMTENGGLLTDFRSGTNPDKQNFPKRNRIVAGICDALIVIESAKKGGSLITAELANSYNKDVFAIPGRITDAKSEGCNYLVGHNKAQLLTSADELLDFMNWKEKEKPALKKQRELFIDLTPQQKIITEILQQNEHISIDELYLKSGLSSSAAAEALLMLEMQGIVISMPGKMYKLA